MSKPQTPGMVPAGSYYLPDYIEDELEDGRVPANEFGESSSFGGNI